MNIDVNGTIGKAVADYTGSAVLEADCVPDPQVRGCYAVRALVKPEAGNASIVEFLIKGVPLQNLRAGDLEEVEFTSWPPRHASENAASGRCPTCGDSLGDFGCVTIGCDE